MIAKGLAVCILALMCKTQNQIFVEGLFRGLRESIERNFLEKEEADQAVNALFPVLRQHGLDKLWSKLIMEEFNPGYEKPKGLNLQEGGVGS